MPIKQLPVWFVLFVLIGVVGWVETLSPTLVKAKPQVLGNTEPAPLASECTYWKTVVTHYPHYLEGYLAVIDCLLTTDSLQAQHWIIETERVFGENSQLIKMKARLGLLETNQTEN